MRTCLRLHLWSQHRSSDPTARQKWNGLRTGLYKRHHLDTQNWTKLLISSTYNYQVTFSFKAEYLKLRL